MLRIEETTTIECSADRLLGLVMDIEAYAEVDRKIRPVLWSRRVGDTVEFACRPTLAGLPQPTVVQRMHLVPGVRVDITLAPAPANRLARAMAGFRASFACEDVPEGVRVVRTLEFCFARPVALLLEPLFRRRLPAEVREELALARRHLEDTG